MSASLQWVNIRSVEGHTYIAGDERGGSLVGSNNSSDFFTPTSTPYPAKISKNSHIYMEKPYIRVNFPQKLYVIIYQNLRNSKGYISIYLECMVLQQHKRA